MAANAAGEIVFIGIGGADSADTGGTASADIVIYNLGIGALAPEYNIICTFFRSIYIIRHYSSMIRHFFLYHFRSVCRVVT